MFVCSCVTQHAHPHCSDQPAERVALQLFLSTSRITSREIAGTETVGALHVLAHSDRGPRLSGCTAAVGCEAVELLAIFVASGMLRVLRRPDQLSVFAQLSRTLNCSASITSPSRSEKCDVPAGHQNSDLRSVACHIGLNRRRDLSLREDLCLFQPGGKATVKDIFKVRTTPPQPSKRSSVELWLNLV